MAVMGLHSIQAANYSVFQQAPVVQDTTAPVSKDTLPPASVVAPAPKKDTTSSATNDSMRVAKTDTTNPAVTDTIKGKVVDQTNKPVIGANVVSGEGNVTATSDSGSFAIPGGPRTRLSVTNIGYRDTAVIAQAGDSSVKVTLAANKGGQQLQTVTVTALGITKKNKCCWVFYSRGQRRCCANGERNEFR